MIMSYRIMESGRDYMRERGGDPQKLMQCIEELHEKLDELGECIEEMSEGEMSERGNYGERGHWEARGIMERGGYGERRGRR